MQLKSTRGVQQDDVWAAADALLAEGLRPTIERVRQKIGRGSPNTVSPMLEAWFATLGPRLGEGGAKEEEGNLPAPVRQGMAKLWESALLSARQDAAQALEQAQQALVQDRTSLEMREAELARQGQVLRERQVVVDEALEVSRGQITDLTTRLDRSHTLLDRRDGEIEDLRSKLTAFEKQRDADRRRSDEEATRHADERRRLEERAAANERRLLEEVDRERQEKKLMHASISNVEKRAETARNEQEEKRRWHDTQIAKAQELVAAQAMELKGLRQALEAANARSDELSGLLEKQRTASDATIIRLTQALSDQPRLPLMAADIPKGKPFRRKAQRPVVQSSSNSSPDSSSQLEVCESNEKAQRRIDPPGEKRDNEPMHRTGRSI